MVRKKTGFEALWAAFSFLTRLVPGRVFSQASMAAAPLYFPLVGLVLGALAALPLVCALLFTAQLAFTSATASTSPHSAPTLLAAPALWAWAYVALLFWATRGLHWDGLADCFDAWGSGARAEEFQRILKDSRIGAFGVMGIALVLTAQLAALYSLLGVLSVAFGSPAPSMLSLQTVENMGTAPDAVLAVLTALVLAPAWGRTAMIVLACRLKAHPASTLGKLVAPGCRASLALCWFFPLFFVWAFALSWGSAALAVGLCLGCLVPLGRLARREGGYNGDFLGCACLCVETACLWAALAGV